MAPTIGILEAGAVAEKFHGHFTSFTDSFRDFLAPDGGGPNLVPYRCHEGEFPESGATHDGWLITGGAASVYDGDAWIAGLEAFARTAAQSKPVVGICFGHQLLAQAFGGTVAKAPGWGIGVHSHAVKDRAAKSLDLLASHQDQVVTPPPGAEVLGGSDFCPIGVMTVGPNVLSIQNHPELTKAFAAELYEGRRGTISAQEVDVALDSLSQPTNEAEARSWILNFLAR